MHLAAAAVPQDAACLRIGCDWRWSGNGDLPQADHYAGPGRNIWIHWLFSRSWKVGRYTSRVAPTYQCPRLTERDHKEHSIRQAGRMVIFIPVDLSSESQPRRDLKRGSQWQALYGAVAGAESRCACWMFGRSSRKPPDMFQRRPLFRL
jgi:hypothetical protein